MDSCCGSNIDAVERRCTPLREVDHWRPIPEKQIFSLALLLSLATSSGPGDELRFSSASSWQTVGGCLGTEASESKMFEPLILEAYMLL